MENPKRFKTLQQVYRQQAVDHGSSVAFRHLHKDKADITLSWQELDSLATQLSQKLRETCSKGDRVIIPLPSCPEFMPAVLGCWHAGVVPIPIYPPKPNDPAPGIELIERIGKLSEATAILSLKNILDCLSERSELSSTAFIDIQEVEEQAATPATVYTCKPEDTALLLFTSGSTGAPKGVVITHEMLISNYREFLALYDLKKTDTVCVWLPHCHIAGFYLRTFNSLNAGEVIEFPATDFLEAPGYWLTSISKYKVAITAAPNFAYSLLSNIELPEGLDLSGWKMAITGGEVVKPDVFHDLVAKLSPSGFKESAFVPYYGMTETLCSTLRFPGQKLPGLHLNRAALSENRAVLEAGPSTDRVSLLSNGNILHGNDVRIVNPETFEECEEDEIGEIWTRGASVTPGYWQQEAFNKKLCEARIMPDGSDHYFRTGDLAFLHDRELYITGRLKEIIIIRGKNYYPQDIEATVFEQVTKQYGIRNCVAFSIHCDGEEQLGIAVEALQTSLALENEMQDRVLQSVAAKHGIRPKVKVLFTNPLPRTSTGKIRRGECARLLSEGVWDAVNLGRIATEQLNADATTLDKIIYEISQILNCSSNAIDPGKWVKDIGLDSMEVVVLLSRLKSKHAIDLNIGLLYEAITLQDLSEILDGDKTPVTAQVDYKSEFIQIESILGDAPLPKLSKRRKNVFLTGGTGFLGSYLLKDLLQKTDVSVCCLVRCNSIPEGLARLRKKLEYFVDYDSQWLFRIHVIPGNLDQEHFGLTEAEFETLSSTVDLILHNGANVNFVANYASLYPVNVACNHTILKLATRSRLKPIHYVSTVAVFNGPERDRFSPIMETDFLSSPQEIFSGYAQTKWVSEAFFNKVRSKGIPVTIYRPALVMGDAKTGYCHTDDFVCRFIKGCIQMGAFPDIDLQLDMTPVDYVSKAIVHILQNPEYWNQAYHLRNDSPIPLGELANWFADYGYEVSLMGVDAWHEAIATKLDESNALYPVYPFLLQKLPASDETILRFFGKRSLNLDSSNTRKVLEGSSIICPPVNHSLLDCYVRYFTETGFLPQLVQN